MKFKKIIMSTILSLMVAFTTFIPTLRAQEPLSTSVKLVDMSTSIPYKSSDILLNRVTNGNEVKVTVTDKKTGNVLVTIGEINYKSQAKPVKNTYDSNQLYEYASKLSGGTTYQTIVYSDKVIGDVTARLQSYLEIYSYGSSRQINRVVSSSWSSASSGPYTLEDKTTSAYLDATPGTKATTLGSCTIQVKTSKTLTGGFSLKVLESLGYSVTISGSSEYYARLAIQHSFTYSLY